MKKLSLKKLKPLRLKKKPQIFFKGTKKGPLPKKEKEGKQNKPKSPNIYRIITESRWLQKNDKILLTIVFTILFAIPFGILSARVYETWKLREKVLGERQHVASQIQYWQGIADKHKDYRDAYFQLALLEYRLKDFEKSRFYLEKTLDLDPNFEEGRELEKILSD